MKLTVFLIFLFAFSATAQDTTTKFFTKEIEWTKSLNLADFGAPHIEVIVHSEMTYVTVQTLDYTQMVPVSRASIQVDDSGYNNVNVYAYDTTVMVPTRQTQSVKKEKGIPSPDRRNQMYLLFHEPKSGIKVYYLDTISGMNRNSVVVAVPKSPSPKMP